MQIAPEQWPALSRLLDAALDLEPAARARWLDSLPPLDARLAAPLRDLLARHARIETSDFLGELPRIALPPTAGTALAQGRRVGAGTAVGPYLIEAEIGRGGMGVVWRARRADGVLKRPVALKLPRMSGYDGDILARFARERDILAALEHPLIARLYDAGQTDDGQVFLAMEYVEGETLTAYCDGRRLGIAARLALFLQVLGAVRFAHRHLTIHRDLKPSNILVTADGQVRLLDFGVAKLLPADGATPSGETEFGARALTPEYAAPEQLTGGAVTTATDVYSLGVVLYELVTGSRPYRPAHPSRGALEHEILAGEPRRPSLAIESDAAAEARATRVDRLRQTLRGDLDTIVMTALKKRAEERFATIDAFAADLGNYLEGRPVLSRPDGAWYRSSKFLRRHRILAGSAGAVLVALTTGFGVALWQSHEARRQAAIAGREADRARAVQAFLVDLFNTNTDAQPDPVKARARTARQMLDLGAARVEHDLGGVPEVEADVLVTLTDMYSALGLDEEAARLQLRRLELLKRLRGPDDPEVADEILAYAESVDTLQGSRRALEPLGEARRILDRRPDAPAEFRARLLDDTARVELKLSPAAALRAATEAVAFYRQRLPDSSGLGRSLGIRARARLWLGDYTGADADYEAAIADARRHAPDALGDLLTAELGRADALSALGRIEPAEAELRTAYAESARRNGENHVDTVHAETRLGALLHATGRRPEGRRLLESAAARIARGGELASTNLVGPVTRNLGMALLADGRWRDAEAPLRQNLELKRRLGVGALLAGALDDLGVLCTLTGRHADAQALLEEAERTWDGVAGTEADPARRNRFRLDAGRLRLATGDARGAEAAFREVVASRDTRAMPLDADRVAALTGLGAAALARGDAREAARLAAAALTSIEQAPTRRFVPTLEADALLVLGRAETLADDAQAAAGHLERARALREANEAPASAWIAEADGALAAAALARGDRADARRRLARANAVLGSRAEVGPQFRAPLRALAAALAAR